MTAQAAFISRRHSLIFGALYAFVLPPPPAPPGNGALYRLLLPHWINDVFLDQGITVTDGVEVPGNWVPTLNVEPLNAVAVTQYWTAGPRGLAWEAMNRYQLEGYAAQPLPVTYWKRTAGNLAQLTGLGSGLPPKVV